MHALERVNPLHTIDANIPSWTVWVRRMLTDRWADIRTVVWSQAILASPRAAART
jgi:hypothetical protein